jgi:hypothetical protein
VLQRARVVAMTTTGVASQQQLVAAMRPRVSATASSALLSSLRCHAVPDDFNT